MKFLSMRVMILFATVAVSACAPSPLFHGNRQSLAPGPVPRNANGQPIVNGEPLSGPLNQPASASGTQSADQSTALIYFDDLHYTGRPATAVARMDQQSDQKPLYSRR